MAFVPSENLIHMTKQLSIYGIDMFYKESCFVCKNNPAAVFVDFFCIAAESPINAAVFFRIRLKVGDFNFWLLF